jgi:hypothetical protein
MPRFVLIHSPLVGPGTWAPVAQVLAARGCEVTVPSLLGIAEDGPPYWPRVAAAVSAAAGAPQMVLAAHSNAGVFIPVIRRALPARPACSLFVDATVPPVAGTAPNTEESFLGFLRGLAGPDGRLPKWADWWPAEEAAALFPDQATRDRVSGEQPRLPLGFFTEEVPVPAGWDDHPCGYLQFSEGYDGPAREAARRGWPVRTVAGQHLHQLTDPAAVAQALLEMAGAPA